MLDLQRGKRLPGARHPFPAARVPASHAVEGAPTVPEQAKSSDARRQGTLVALSVAAAIGALAARRLWRRSRYRFRGRVVLLTGGTRGLGLAMGRQLVSKGAHVWLVARSTDELRDAVADLKARGGSVRSIRADIRDPAAPEQVVREVVDEAGRIDVLVNNAGVTTVAPFEHLQLEDIAESIATHFWGPLRLIRAATPYMTCDGSGRIINISSIGGRIGVPHLGAYAAGKFALVGLSETLRAELKREGILVTTVTPGLMRTGSYVNARVR
jgi:NAD(P)-dependent dehydrogenase (short-subunit alcohol dehydrogenase family)